MYAIAICGSQSQLLLGLEIHRTWTYAVRLCHSAFQDMVLHMCVRGDCNVMVEALEPVTVFGMAHVFQWRSLKLLNTDFEKSKGVSRTEKVWKKVSSRP